MNKATIRACILGLVILVAEQMPAHGQVSLILGGALMNGTAQSPYVYGCGSEDHPGAVGSIAYAGVGVSDFSLTAGYVTVTSGWFDESCPIREPRADGVHRERDYSARYGGIYGWAFHLRYSPGRLPFMAYAGGGHRFGGKFGGHQFVSLGAEVHTRGRLSVFVGGEFTQLHTPYVQYDRAWENGTVTSSTEVGRGYGWRKVEVIRVGLQYRWRLSRAE